MRARITITDKVKEEKDMVYYRYTEDEWSSQFQKDFKKIKKEGEVPFFYIEEYPFRKTVKDKHAIQGNQSNVVQGPILVLGRLLRFKPYRKELKLKPVFVGTCRFIGADKEFENEGEAPESNHLAMVGAMIGRVRALEVKKVLIPVKKYLGDPRFFIYKEMPASVEQSLKDRELTSEETPGDLLEKINNEIRLLKAFDEMQMDQKEAKARLIGTLIDQWQEDNPLLIKRKTRDSIYLQKVEEGLLEMEQKHDDYEKILELMKKMEVETGQDKLERAEEIELKVHEFEKTYGLIEG